jgi:signal transduction histidine kinase
VKLSWRLIQERVGGRHAISLAVFLIGSPFWVVGFVLNEPATYESLGSAALVMVITLCGQAVMGMVLFLAHLTVARNRTQKPVSLVVMAVVWGSSSVARILTVVFAFDLSGLPDTVPLGTRIAASAMMAIAGYGLGSYGMDALDRFRNERARILSELIDSDEQLAAHRVTVDTMKDVLVHNLDNQLKQAGGLSTQSLDRLEQAITSRMDTKPALEELRLLSEDTWRTVSQDLWAKAPSTAPTIKISEMLTLFSRSGPFQIPFLATGAFFLYLLVYARTFDPVTGAVVTIAWLGAMVPVSLAFNAVLRRLTKFSITSFAVLALAIILSSFPLLAVAEVVGVTTDDPARVFGVHTLTMTLIVMSALLPTIGRASRGILDTLRGSIDATAMEKLHIESQIDIASKKLASRLHGDIRGNFLASVLALQKNLETDDVDQARATIDKLRKLLAETIELGPESPEATRQALQEFLTNWSALVDISLEKPLQDIPAEFLSAFHTVVVDAVNNAVRHGKADWIRIGFSLENDGLVVNIMNNGRKDSSNRVGLGTLHLNQLAGDMWNRSTNEQGITQLVARLDRSRLGSPTPSV